MPVKPSEKIRRFAANSEAWRERAERVLCGKQSNFRSGPSRAPVISARGEGVRVIDVDGKDYIDFVLGMGPAIWGYSNAELAEAITEQIDRQFSAASSIMHTPAEIELAEKIVEYVPCAEKVRFGLTGTEADQLALRLARGYTGKRYVVRFAGHYHGWVDNVFGGAPPQDATPYPVMSASTGAGLAPHSLADVMMTKWNDAQALEALLDAHSGEIALVIMEAVMCNNGCCPPRPGYLERVRELCTKYDVLLCFDEVITGFRLSMGGAQGALGVSPDLAVFGKALAGGLPLSAVAGKAEVMAKLSENVVLGGGTFNSFPLSMASGVATMRMLERNNFAVFSRVDEVQEKIAKALRESARRHGFDLLVQGPRGMIFFAFTDREIAWTPDDLKSANEKLALAFRERLEDEGVLIGAGSRLVISAAMTDEDVEEAISRIERAMARLGRQGA